MEPSLEADPRRTMRDSMFVSDLEFECELSTDGSAMAGHATVTDALRFPGSAVVRPSVLATIADCVTGLPACLVTAPGLAVTLDIVVRTMGTPSGDRLDMTVTIVKPGRRTVAGEVAFTDPEDGRLVAHSYLTFMASPLSSGHRTTAVQRDAVQRRHAHRVPRPRRPAAAVPRCQRDRPGPVRGPGVRNPPGGHRGPTGRGGRRVVAAPDR